MECRGFGLRLVWEDEVRRDGMSRRGPRRCSKSSKKNSSTSREPSVVATIQSNSRSSDALEAESLPPSLSPLPPFLSPVQSFLFDRYRTRFAPTYFSCRDPQMPFLSMIVPLAMKNNAVMSVLVALSGIQAGREGSLEIKLEMLRAKQATLNGCRRLLRDLTQDRLSHEDTLMLFAVVLLLMLHEQVTDATYWTIQPHLRFAYWISNILDHAESAVSRATAPYYNFLRSILLYDDLVASISARRPPLVGYGNYLDMINASSTASSGDVGKYYLPAILTRISSGDGTVRIDDIDKWDSRMDWLPSFFTIPRCSNDSEPGKDTTLISEIYCAVSKLFFYQMSPTRPTTTVYCVNNDARPKFCSAAGACIGHMYASTCSEAEAAVVALRHRALTLIRDLPEESQYQGALLWPIGILAQEVGINDSVSQSYILDVLARLEHRYGMKHFSRYKTKLALAWSKKKQSLYQSRNA